MKPHQIIAEELNKIGWIGRNDAQHTKLEQWWNQQRKDVDEIIAQLQQQRDAVKEEFRLYRETARRALRYANEK